MKQCSIVSYWLLKGEMPLNYKVWQGLLTHLADLVVFYLNLQQGDDQHYLNSSYPVSDWYRTEAVSLTARDLS